MSLLQDRTPVGHSNGQLTDAHPHTEDMPYAVPYAGGVKRMTN